MKKASRVNGRLLRIKPGDVLLSHTLARAVPSGLRGLTTVFGMGTGGSLSLWSPRNWRHKGQPILPMILQGSRDRKGAVVAFGLNIDGLDKHSKNSAHIDYVCVVVFYGQAERAISNGKLNALLRLHIRPIKQVVFLRPS
jgi:hypothetical protein